jgi:hypothetical protein
MQLEKLSYSKQETAYLLNLSVHTITRDVRLGRIQVRHYGRRVLIPVRSFSELRRTAWSQS